MTTDERLTNGVMYRRCTTPLARMDVPEVRAARICGFASCVF
jgi:hypothetical protein